ncbi:MAG: hypothetical protein HYZ53_14825 [Planctomycetes bacterium]|nr:hypothetical protein [Planctomycetota bacterium]
MGSAGQLFLALGAALALAALSLAGVAALLVRLPADFFIRPPREAGAGPRSPAALFRLVGKNLLGLALVAVGVVLAVPGVPGQGLLTLLLGVVLLDIPGKARLERALLGRPGVLRGLNRLRARYGRPALAPPPARRPEGNAAEERKGPHA